MLSTTNLRVTNFIAMIPMLTGIGRLLACLVPTDCLRSLENWPPFHRAFRQYVGNPEAMGKQSQVTYQACHPGAQSPATPPSVNSTINALNYTMWIALFVCSFVSQSSFTMAKENIPVYDICSISKEPGANDDFLADRFSSYLNKYYEHLHFPHRHSFYHLVLFTKGKGTHSIDFTTFDVKPFQLYAMIPGQVHSWHFEGPMEGFIINFSDNFFKSFLQHPQYLDRFSFFSGIGEEGVCQLPGELHKQATQLLESILTYSGHDWKNQVDMVRVLLLQLFMLIDNSLAAHNIKSIPQQKLILLRGFRRLIDTHYRSIRLPKEYADLLYVTPNHLNALCQDLLGKTAGELIRERILLEAKRLLTNARMTVTEIAYDLNFQDNSYFNRFFKKYTGMTPDEFRKQFHTENK